MGKYGQAALEAVNLIMSSNVKSPIDAWEAATIEIFGEGTSSQKKGCPRSTFIGLCEEGFVCNVSKTDNSKLNKSKNKDYGVKAIQLLRNEPSLSKDTKILWEKVLDGEVKQHNSQLDVVKSLWENNLIVVNN